MAKTRTVPVFRFQRIEADWAPLAPLRMGKPSPAVGKDHNGSYYVRVLARLAYSSTGVTERYDYFRFDAEGNITQAPYGHAKAYKPGRVAVEELDEAVQRYAKAVR